MLRTTVACIQLSKQASRGNRLLGENLVKDEYLSVLYCLGCVAANFFLPRMLQLSTPMELQI